MSKITIACVLRTPEYTGHPAKQKHYSELDVLKLKKSFENYLKIPHKFVCLSDREIPTVNTIQLIGDTPHWWAKLELFRPSLFNTPVLYIDLDMIICNYLDDMLEKFYNESFLLLGDSTKGVFGSGMIYFNGDHSDLWNKYSENPKLYQELYSRKPRYGDQAFIEDTKSFKVMTEISGVDPEWFSKLTFKSTHTENAKILICVGKGNKLSNPGYAGHPWVEKYWRNI